MLTLPVVVIEDDAVVQAVIVEVLQGEGCEVHLPTTYLEAQAMIRVHHPGLVVSDFVVKEFGVEPAAGASLPQLVLAKEDLGARVGLISGTMESAQAHPLFPQMDFALPKPLELAQLREQVALAHELLARRD